MNLKELIASARRKAFDTNEPGKLAKAEWIEIANDAQNEACRRLRALKDSTTPAICTLPVLVGIASYPLDSRILFVRRVKLASKSNPTQKVSYRDLDELAPGWETSTGEIEGYCLDYQKGQLRFYRTPTATDTATMTVVRMPLADMEVDDDEPELPARYHVGLINWMLHLYYSNDDAEIADSAKADKYEAKFAVEFGAKSTAIEENWIIEHHGYNEDEGLY